MEQSTLERQIRALQKQGYSAEQVGETILVKDPVHRCGYGPDAGRLILSGYVDCVLTTSNEVMKFMSDRS